MLALVARRARSLPLEAAVRAGERLGLLWHDLVPVRRGVARRNVARALGAELGPAEQRRVVRDCFAHLGALAVEALRLPDLTPALADELVPREGEAWVERALARGRGVVLVTAHLGNFELLACAEALRGLKLHVFARALRLASVERHVAEARRRAGVRALPVRGSGLAALAALRRGEAVAVAIDQHMPRDLGVVSTLFGQLVSTTPAPALLALSSGAALVPALAYRRGAPGHHVARFGPELELERPHGDLAADVRHNTVRLDRLLEGWIREAPAQWLWLHRRFKVHDDPRGWDVPPELAALARAGRTGGSAGVVRASGAPGPGASRPV